MPWSRFWGPLQTPNDDEDVFRLQDDRETRCFCPDRYRLSKHLPEIIRALPEQNVFQTGKGNFVTIEIIDD